MTIIKVHPNEVVIYGNSATGHFGTIVDQLQQLTTMINDVQFEGQSAFQFRTDTGVLLSDFTVKINSAMTAMVTNVQNAVGNIQASMEGQRVTLQIPEPTPIPETDKRNTENSEMDTEALAGLNIEAPLTAISEAFAAHQSDLNSVTWLGNQGDAAREAVGTLTTQATGVCSTYATEFRRVINAQVERTTEADATAV